MSDGELFSRDFTLADELFVLPGLTSSSESIEFSHFRSQSFRLSVFDLLGNDKSIDLLSLFSTDGLDLADESIDTLNISLVASKNNYYQ